MEKSFCCPFCGSSKTIVIADESNPLAPVRLLTIQDIIPVVTSVTNVTHEQMMAYSSQQGIVRARQYCYFFGYYCTLDGLKEIGLEVAAQSHATVLHGKNQITNFISTKDTDTISMVGTIRYRLMSLGFDIPDVKTLKDKYLRKRAFMCEFKPL